MLYQISDGSLSFGGKSVLSHVDFEIRGTEKIAVVGSNGAGKTSLLRLLAGELDLDRDDKRQGPGIIKSRALSIEMLKQQTFVDLDRTVEEEFRWEESTERQFEYDALFTGFGFRKEDRAKRLAEFSGGERTKIALIRLLLKKPDVLLLDEPTNHLDIHTVEWLERYLKKYGGAVVMVSHDRFFIDETADVIYELENGKLTRYPGNYTNYRIQKAKNRELQQKAYERYIEEKERLEALIERFKHKPNKAAFARAKKKTLERMPKVEKPEEEGPGIFAGEIVPEVPGSKRVLECEKLQIGYEEALLEVTMRIRKGQKIAVLGDNGVGKSTFLKTVAGLLEPLKGKVALGNNTVLGYYDQHSAETESEKRVLEHFCELFPSLPEKDARKILGMYLFGGNDAGKKVRDLSGGEKVRLILAELLNSRPNFLLLDEPTNHCDVRAKERLEQAFKAYKGTMLFISHDRYFVQELADAVLIFEGKEVFYYPFGYRHYLEQKAKMADGNSPAARRTAEEQALIDGLKAVPKAERHRLREISTESAYEDWKMGPVCSKLEETEAQYVWACRQREEAVAGRESSEEFWNAFSSGAADLQYEGSGESEAAVEVCWEAWHRACLDWYETLLELEESIAD